MFRFHSKVVLVLAACCLLVAAGPPIGSRALSARAAGAMDEKIEPEKLCSLSASVTSTVLVQGVFFEECPGADVALLGAVGAIKHSSRPGLLRRLLDRLRNW
jgi:hypothetical protein